MRTPGILLACAVTAAVLTGCSNDEPDSSPVGDTSSEGSSEEPGQVAVGACEEAFTSQQIGPDFKPMNPREDSPRLESSIGVGTLADGLCLDTTTEMYAEGWTVVSIDIRGSVDAETEREPVTFSRTSNLETESVPLLVPLDGCVKVSGSIAAIQDSTGEARTWEASGVYGRDCEDERSGGEVIE